MKIFVTGAGGFLGRHLLAVLAEAGHATTSLLLPTETAPEVATTVLRGDLTDPMDWADALGGHDAVVHLAGVVGYGVSRAACEAVNVAGTAYLADAARRAGVRRFVHLSSVSVYGRTPDRPLDEDSMLRLTGDPYGDTKSRRRPSCGALPGQGSWT